VNSSAEVVHASSWSMEKLENEKRGQTPLSAFTSFGLRDSNKPSYASWLRKKNRYLKGDFDGR
jgi:hypothetical protein